MLFLALPYKMDSTTETTNHVKSMKDIKTIGQLFLKRVQNKPLNQAIGWIDHDQIKFYSYKEYQYIVHHLSIGLVELGFKRQDHAAILGQTTKEWHFIDLGIVNACGVVVPIYPSYTSEELEWIIKHSECEFLFVENINQFKKLSKTKLHEFLKCVIVIDDSDIMKDDFKDYTWYNYQDLIDLGRKRLEKEPEFAKELISSQSPADLMTIIYTSGTTGEPKGAMITQNGFVTMLNNISSGFYGQIDSRDRTLTFLPLSHVLGRCDSYLNLEFGLEVVYAESIEKILKNLEVVKPTIMIAVPRIFEKVYENINNLINDGSLLKRATVDWALAASQAYFKKIDKDLAPNTLEILQKNLAYKAVFKKVYDKFGGKIRFFVSGGAPLNKEIIEFLRNANLTILEGYGLTETIAPCTVNRVVKQIPGTVGLPLGDVKVSFEEDGEIKIHSEALFTGYYKNDQATQEAFKDGWFLTGDIGQLSSEGYLVITDRKKDIIITSGGKNIAPQKIESLLKLSPLVSQFVVIGEKKKYLTGLVSINKEAFYPQLEEMGLSRHSTYDHISSHSLVRSAIAKEIEQINTTLQKHEQIKDFRLLPHDLTLENGFLTPSLKVKRKEVVKYFHKEIDSMYKN